MFYAQAVFSNHLAQRPHTSKKRDYNLKRFQDTVILKEEIIILEVVPHVGAVVMVSKDNK